MVEYMRSTVAFVLIFGNFILSSLNILFSLKAYNYLPYLHIPNYNYRYLSSINEKLVGKNQNYFIKDILEKEIETPKELRNLSLSELRLSLIFTNVSSFIFIILFIMTFWITKNECCNGDKDIVAAFPVGSCNGKCICCGECQWIYFSKCCQFV